MFKFIKKIEDSVILSDGIRLRIRWDGIETISTWNQYTEVEIEQEDNLFWPIRIRCLNKPETVLARYWINDDLVPKGKFDFETVLKLEGASLAEVEPLLSDLFEWTEDINWPIASKLSEVLAQFGKEIIPYVIYYLRNPCGLNEYGTYYYLMPKLNKEQLLLLKSELMIIMQSPSSYQREEGYDKFAEEYIRKLEGMN